MNARNELEFLQQLGMAEEEMTFPLGHLATFTLRKEIVEHREFTRTIREIARLHHRGLQAGVAEGMLLVAQTGSGKTTALDFYEARFPRTRTKEGANIPVLRVDTPESPSVKTLAEAILDALGDGAASKGTATAKTRRIELFLRKCGVQLLLIDEFQHFIDGHRTAESKRVSDWLKNLIRRACIPVVLAGLPRAIAVLNSNPQLRRRFGAPHYMKPLGFQTKAEQLEFRGVLKSLQESLPLPCVDFSEANMARRFFYASCGLIDYVVKIIDDAASRGGGGNSGAITQADLAQAFVRSVWREAPKSLNPFEDGSALRILKGPGEPFDVWDDIDQYTSVGRSKSRSTGKAKPGSRRAH
jgi:hypothetical protein